VRAGPALVAAAVRACVQCKAPRRTVAAVAAAAVAACLRPACDTAEACTAAPGECPSGEPGLGRGSKIVAARRRRREAKKARAAAARTGRDSGVPTEVADVVMPLAEGATPKTSSACSRPGLEDLGCAGAAGLPAPMEEDPAGALPGPQAGAATCPALVQPGASACASTSASSPAKPARKGKRAPRGVKEGGAQGSEPSDEEVFRFLCAQPDALSLSFDSARARLLLVRGRGAGAC